MIVLNPRVDLVRNASVFEFSVLNYTRGYYREQINFEAYTPGWRLKYKYIR